MKEIRRPNVRHAILRLDLCLFISKTVTEAWDGYQSIPLDKESSNLTTGVNPLLVVRQVVVPVLRVSNDPVRPIPHISQESGNSPHR